MRAMLTMVALLCGAAIGGEAVPEAVTKGMQAELARLKARAAGAIPAATLKAKLEPLLAAKGRNDTGWMFRDLDIKALAANTFAGDLAARLDAAPAGGQGSPTDALSSLAHFHRECRRVGVHLVVMPIPTSAMVYSGRLIGGDSTGKLAWPAYNDGMIKLLEQGVDVVDLVDDFAAVAPPDGALHQHDHHWSPTGMEIAARKLADRLAGFAFLAGGAAEKGKYTTKDITVANPQYLGVMNGIIRRGGKMPGVPTQCTAKQVLYADAPVKIPAESPLLLLGDSMLDHFHKESAGICAHVARATGVVPSREWVKAGSPGMAKVYAQKWGPKPNQPKVLVWCIYGTGLTPGYGQWTRVDLPGGGSGAPATAAVAGPIALVATIKRVSKVPDPAKVDYDDAVMVSECTVDKVTGGAFTAKTVLIVQMAFEDRKLLPAAKQKVGDKLALNLESFEAAAARSKDLGNVQRIDDIDDFANPLYWVVSAKAP